MKVNVVVIGIALTFLLVIGGVFAITAYQNKPSLLDDFTKCLKDKGAKFYGAYWCPHCQNQKKLFGTSEKYLPYIECSTLDGKDQLSVCKEQKIEGYPTWKFQSGATKSGELSLEDLAKETSCKLP